RQHLHFEGCHDDDDDFCHLNHLNHLNDFQTCNYFDLDHFYHFYNFQTRDDYLCFYDFYYLDHFIYVCSRNVYWNRRTVCPMWWYWVDRRDSLCLTIHLHCIQCIRELSSHPRNEVSLTFNLVQQYSQCL
ncbi:hypothetical protein C0991_009958, partial [Blastosporella zonata]